MPSNKSGTLDDIALLDIAIEIQRIVEEREGVQGNAGVKSSMHFTLPCSWLMPLPAICQIRNASNLSGLPSPCFPTLRKLITSNI